MKSKVSCWSVIVALTIGLSSFTLCGQEFRPQRVLDEQPTITAAPFMSAAQGEQDLNPNELVLGVSMGSESRAYPLNMLTGPTREIINDSIGETPFAATW